jgi:hypothetical protein
MIKAFAPEHDGLVISRLYPVELTLDVPEPASGQGSNAIQSQQTSDTIFQDALRDFDD